MKAIHVVYVVTILSSLLLSGCAHIDRHFECPMAEPVHCKSLDEINQMVINGQLGQPVQPSKKPQTRVL